MSAEPVPTSWEPEIARLHPEDVEAIAVRVAALLQSATSPMPVRLVDAATLAKILDVERDWIYTHAKQLGAVRLGGERGRLRFDLATVFRSLNADNKMPTSSIRPPSVAKTVARGVKLLPIDP